jgi:hypothetical protein
VGVPSPRLPNRLPPSQRKGGAGAGGPGSPCGQLAPCSTNSPGASGPQPPPFPPALARTRGKPGKWVIRAVSCKQTLPCAGLHAPATLQASAGPERGRPDSPPGGAGRVPAPPRCARRCPCRCAAQLALPPPPQRGPSLYYGNSDIQRERLTQTQRPGSRGAEAGGGPAVRTWHPCTAAGRQRAAGAISRRPGQATAPVGALSSDKTSPLRLSGAGKGQNHRDRRERPCLTARIWQSFSPSSWAAHCRARAPLPCLR